MSDIDGLSDQNKSMILARLLDWETKWSSASGHILLDIKNQEIISWIDNLELPDLYDPANMALAWRVLNWAYREDKIFSLAIDVYEFGSHFLEWAPKTALEAQRLWLDKILELAIEAGLVELEKTP